MSGPAVSLSEQLTTLAGLLGVYVVPIMQDCERGLPKSIGSGLLVKHLSTPYIATAAHVFSHHLSDRPLYFYCTSHRKHLLGNYSPLRDGSATA